MTEISNPFEVDLIDDSGQEFPWAPQPGETALGFQAFCSFRDLGPKRSVAAAARELGRETSVLRALSAKFNWVDRCIAFDAWLDRKSVEELARGRTKMRTEHAEVAVIAREKILARLKALDPDEMSVRDLATWLDLSVKVERQARGEADKTIQVNSELTVIEQLDAGARRNLMQDALRTLSDRLGIPKPGELEASIIDAEVVESVVADGESDWMPDEDEDEDDGGI